MTDTLPSEDRLVLSPDQDAAMKRITTWFSSDDTAKTLTLGGYAGTGKTTLLGQLPVYLPSVRIHYCSYTGKAVSVLAKKLPRGLTVTTLHRLLYKPRQRTICKVSKEDIINNYRCPKHLPESIQLDDPPCETTKLLDWSPNMFPLEGIDLVVVDEASMVSEKIWSDLTRWGVPVLAVGDHGQLPPIKSEFNLMRNPEIKLETILRQAEGSPIIQMAGLARKLGTIPHRTFGEGGVCIRRHQMHEYPMDPDNGDLIICGYNNTRNDLNEAMRGLLGRTGPPTTGDIVICLRNSYEHGVFNGMRGRIRDLDILDYRDGDTGFAVIEMLDEDFDYTGEIDLRQFGQPKTLNDTPRYLGLFDYGYAMTCHKAQGSQADRVMVIDEKLPSTDHRRWLYTAVTRAANELIVVSK